MPPIVPAAPVGLVSEIVTVVAPTVAAVAPVGSVSVIVAIGRDRRRVHHHDAGLRRGAERVAATIHPKAMPATLTTD